VRERILLINERKEKFRVNNGVFYQEGKSSGWGRNTELATFSTKGAGKSQANGGKTGRKGDFRVPPGGSIAEKVKKSLQTISVWGGYGKQG